MKNYDYEFLKKKYGENFAKFCRSLFPGILEQEGVLSNLITDNFAESKFLYEDIIDNRLQTKFKNYIYSKLSSDATKNESVKEVEDPFTLMKKAGYTLYKYETDEQVKSFKKYWNSGEELCTFRDSNRINNHLIFFAVKNNVSEIKRENFKNPLRQDEYGTSVISLQFTLTKPNMLSIKNRYNHRVLNSDSTFSNDLENIVAGLSESFVKEYNLNLVNKDNSFEIPGYVLAQNGKFYKYNYEIENVYYCPDNIIIDQNRQVKEYDKNKYLVLDNFVLDLQKNEMTMFKLYSEHNQSGVDSYADSFVDGFNNISKIQVQKENENKVVTLTPKTGEDIIITLDKANRIIKYLNNNLIQVGGAFLHYNEALTEFHAPNLTQVGKDFLCYNDILTELHAPNLTQVGYNFLYKNNTLTELHAPNLTQVGNYFLYSNETLTELHAPNLTQVENNFLHSNKTLTELHAPNLTQVENNFLHSNKTLTELYLPYLTQVRKNFLWNNNTLTELYLPNLTQIGNEFLYNNNTLTELYAPNLTQIECGFLGCNPNKNRIISTLPKIEQGRNL